MFTVIMDGVSYRLRVKFDTISRNFQIRDGNNADYMVSGLYQRDIVGTYYNYSMEVEPDPKHPEDYDAFYEVISGPVNSHTITLPYGQSTITFNAMVTEGNDVYHGKIGNVSRWTGLQVQFTAIKPHREPTV